MAPDYFSYDFILHTQNVPFMFVPSLEPNQATLSLSLIRSHSIPVGINQIKATWTIPPPGWHEWRMDDGSSLIPSSESSSIGATPCLLNLLLYIIWCKHLRRMYITIEAIVMKAINIMKAFIFIQKKDIIKWTPYILPTIARVVNSCYHGDMNHYCCLNCCEIPKPNVVKWLNSLKCL